MLPVEIGETDDRVEVPEGVEPEIIQGGHPALGGASVLGPLLGYNRVRARPAATVVATCGGVDPLLAVWDVGQGRAFAYTSDCGPHWASTAYADSPDYAQLWAGLVNWAAGAGQG